MAGTPAAKVTKAPSIAVRRSRSRVVGVAWMNAAKGIRAIWISLKNARGSSAEMATMVFEIQTSVKNEISQGPIDTYICDARHFSSTGTC